MTVTIDIDADTERRIEDAAARRGIATSALTKDLVLTGLCYVGRYSEASPVRLDQTLLGLVGVLDSRNQNGGAQSAGSEDETSLADYLEEKRRQGHL